MRPVCVPCQRFFRPDKTGVYFVEAMPVPGIKNAEPGAAAPEQWTPYKLWVADRWRCDGCGAVILSGFGRDPIAEHYQSDFAERVELFGGPDIFQVNDC